MKRSIVWLASYPKSGNTWMRIFLANYLSDAQKPLHINQIQQFGFGDSKPEQYRAAAGRPVDFSSPEATLHLRDRVLQRIVANNADVNFVKTHNCRNIAFGTELIPPRFTRQAIYILRNPLDLLLSYARHYGMSHAETAEAIGRADNANAPDATTTWQFLGSWSDHVKDWTQGGAFPVLALRYEDLLDDPQTHFAKTLDFMGVPVVPERLDRAIRFASFDELKKQEDAGGFSEKSPNADRFFAKGQAGQWKDELDPALVTKVRREHKRMMKKYGYYSV
ncbi:sulfotransferase [Roseovarius atlanticus]|uniref:Sulfotransferase n=1 Tax=Roseovarius atlanticus TaxID=1641875 RepID=A0A0T5NUB0_9RHOB|nr:sulfotransferase domain-containing protein [Roseovarius atlanticus]KRS12449.1 sulfotransferase [Roseovarius atlanticus]